MSEQKIMQVTRLYTGEDGESHFETREIPLRNAGEIGYLSQPEPVAGLIFRETAPDYHYKWHNAPQRQYIVMLEGAVDIEVGDGTVRRFSAGDVLLVEDTTGRGHVTRTVDGRARKSLFVTLE